MLLYLILSCNTIYSYCIVHYGSEETGLLCCGLQVPIGRWSSGDEHGGMTTFARFDNSSARSSHA